MVPSPWGRLYLDTTYNGFSVTIRKYRYQVEKIKGIARTEMGMKGDRCLVDGTLMRPPGVTHPLDGGGSIKG